jgi:hypothetical protein
MYTAAELALLRASDPNPIPGIDTPAGNPLSLSSLKSYTTITTNTSAPIYYVPSLNRIVVQGNGTVANPLVLSGYNFSGAAYVSVYGNNVTIKDCTFTDNVGALATVQLMNTGASGLTVENCTFSGGNEDYGIFSNPNGYMAVINNSFIDSPSHPVTFSNGIVTGNYFSGGAYLPGVHADAISIQSTSGPVTVSNNFIDWTNNPGAPTSTGFGIRIATDGGNTRNVTVTGNVILGGTDAVYAEPTQVTYDPADPGLVGQFGTLSNVNISGNYIGFGLNGAFYPTPAAGVSITNNTVFDYTNPEYSINAWNAYLAKGVGTTYLVSSTGGPSVASNPAGSTTLYGAGQNVHMFGSTSETVFIGGAGGQYMTGGFGANIFKYLAISDSIATHPDTIEGNFDPAKDVIDLSAINADPQGAMQNFTFIGTAPFSGSAGQVRYQYDPTTNETLVQAELVGDSLAGNDNADFQIKLSGDVSLTAANFALTAAQSSADMAAGSALRVTVVGETGAPHELVYTNVQNRSYSSFTEIYPAGGTVVANEAAEAFNNTDGTGSLTLSGANATYTAGASTHSVTVGGTALSITAHATETITTTGASDSFVFQSGFGQDTLNGFGGSDTLQLQKSMFSYLSPSASQSVDLAAVIAHASFSAGAVTIADTAGDRLTLSGFTSATTLAAEAAHISFV